MTRKRAPGAGRKPSGEFSGKSSAFSTRITPELRAALEKESQDTGKSLSQIVERRLRDSFDIPKRWERALGPGHVRALAYVVAKIATSLEVATGQQWNKDAFTSKALRAALKIAVYYFGSKDEVRVPDRVEEQLARMQAASASSRYAESMKDPVEFGTQQASEFVGAVEYLEMEGEPNQWAYYDAELEVFLSEEALLRFIIGHLRQRDEK
ncbi:hypothetical protein M2311_005701 [Rhizobium leguminosarum]|uniref:hypothetical protein n=2 Tax=Rhizobium TaxID=379 RepID=UPI002475D55D|nr:hypothetical protein [Rhizobium leguminosarum]MDH6275601.1 hypothetical protein [Rhizobium leguminosarum]